VKLRLFVAVEIDEAVRAFAAAAAQQLARAGVVGRFEPLEKLHVTVAFLGSVPEAELPGALQALRDASALCRPFELCFSVIGAFPSVRRPRVLWIGPAQESAAFAACAGHVREAYGRLGFTFDNDAVAHISICRPAFVPPNAWHPPNGSAIQSVRGLTLMRSLPAGQTTRYEALERTWF